MIAAEQSLTSRRKPLKYGHFKFQPQQRSSDQVTWKLQL